MTLDYEKLLVKLRKEQAVEAHYDTKQCAVIEQAATAIEALRAEVVEKEARRLEYQKACGRHREAAQIEAEKVAALRAELAAAKARLGEAVGLLKTIYAVGYFRKEISTFLAKEPSQ